MADANFNPTAPVRERIITIARQQRPRPIRDVQDFCRPRPDLPPVPWIRLAGRWLEHAGFAIDARVRIQIENGRLVITPV